MQDVGSQDPFFSPAFLHWVACCSCPDFSRKAMGYITLELLCAIKQERLKYTEMIHFLPGKKT